jgi:hypothetical protein
VSAGVAIFFYDASRASVSANTSVPFAIASGDEYSSGR